ncbi:Exportin-1 [Gryllus bimaculatus]|nr:Exportin-1 [Gryllus bimaculatus]
MEADIAVVAADLARAVELTMDPAVPQQQRMDAYTACERFKETSPLCAQCGFYLAQCSTMSHFVRHFGLQLMEHCVKYRWNQMSQQEKLFIKENAMKLLCNGIEPSLQEHNHMKDAMSRVVVEMIKREWPQQWPSLLAELNNACMRGESQTELVCFVFLRLVEDVALLQTLESNQRRKDIYQALTSNMEEIFSFFLSLIQDHCNKHKTKIAAGQFQEAAANARVVQVVLLTLTGFVEWVSIQHIMADDGHLLQILYLLLDQESFQMEAAECLLQIVMRKGKVEERKPLLVLFSEDAMQCVFKAVGDTSNGVVDERKYCFLKKLCQLLTGLGTQLCTLWGKDEGVSVRPPCFSDYLEVILAFTRHPSLTLSHYANSLWMAFFKHDQISKDHVFLTFIPKWVQSTAPKIIKVSYPSVRSGAISDTAAYTVIDYDSEEEFAAYFHRCRSDMLDAFRQATLVAPLVTFAYVEEWLTIRIQKSMAELSIECNLLHPTFLEWEALSQVLESILSRILLSTERPSVGSGLRLLDLCLTYEPVDPLLLSTLLSCISALFVFLSMSPAESSASLLPRVLDKIFAALVFSEPGQTKESRSRAVKNVRRHAASLMVKIGQKYPLLLLPVFERIHATVQSLNSDPGQLSKMERVTLQEALLLISNHFCDYERQTKFVEEVIGSGASQWLSMGSEAFMGPREFMAFVGLDRPPVEPSSNDLNGQNRAHITFCVNLFMAVVKRCAWPDDPDRASRGGFVVSRTETGNPVCRNPATPHIMPLLPNLLQLLRVFNALWTPDALALLSDGYKAAHAMLVVDRTNLLGVGSPLPADHLDITRPRNQTPLDRMQHFLTLCHDYSYHILGNAGPSLGRDFYGLPGLAASLISTVFSNLERLSNKWQYITQLYETGRIDDENTDTQEVLEDMLNRTLTREYLDVLKVALVGGSTDSGSLGFDMDQDEAPRPNVLLQTEVSELGSLILRYENTCQSVVLCIFRALFWNDTLASLKATQLAAPVVRLLASDGSLNPDVAAHIMTSVLQGLQMHGQHEGNQGSLLSLGAQVYEILRPNFPNIVDVMLQIPNCSPHELQKLDEKIVANNQKGTKVEKAKKEVFKRITSQLIGRSMGQLFRKEMKIADLPKMELPHRPKPPPLDELLQEGETLCPLFTPSTNHAVVRSDIT